MPRHHHLISLTLFLTATLALCGLAFTPLAQAAKLSEQSAFVGPLVETDELLINDYSESPVTRRIDARQIFTPFAADPTWSSDFSASAWAAAIDSTIAPVWSNVTATPTTLSGYGITDAATSAQGALADSATQPGDNVSTLTNDSGYLTSSTGYTQSAVDAALNLKADIADVYATLGAVLMDGLYGDATREIMSGAESDNTDLTDAFTFRDVYSLPDWSPASDVVLRQKIAGNYGWKFILETDGSLTFQIGNGSDFTTLSFSSTGQLSAADWAYVDLVVSADLASGLQFWANGLQLGATVDMSAAINQSLANSGDTDWLVSAEGILVSKSITCNYALTASEVQSRFTNPSIWYIPARNIDGLSRAWDWSAGVDGWVATSGTEVTLTGATSVGGRDDCLTIASAGTGSHRATSDALVTLLDGDAVEISFESYFPSGNSHCDGFDVKVITSGVDLNLYRRAAGGVGAPPLDAWETVTLSGVLDGDSVDNRLQIQMRDNVFASWTPSGQDEFYIRNAQLKVNGVIHSIDLSVSGATKTDETGNGEDATVGTGGSDL